MITLLLVSCTFPTAKFMRSPPCTLSPATSGALIAPTNAGRLALSGTLCDPTERGLVTSLLVLGNDRLVAGRRDSDAVSWDLAGNATVLAGSGEVVGLALGDDALYVGTSSGEVQARDPSPPFAIRWSVFPSSAPTWALVPLPTGELVVGATDGTLARLDPQGMVTLRSHAKGPVWGLVRTSDGRLLVSEAGSGLHWFNEATLKEITEQSFGGPSTVAWQADLDPHGIPAIASEGGASILARPRISFQIGHSTVRQVAWSPNGGALALATWAGSVILLDPVSGHELALLPANQGRVQSVAWSPDGRWLASGGDGGLVRVWAVLP